ncbi:MAG: ferrochelatase, partial [Candidatus Poseidoniaceae archaeon]|nr:ferrochelatase [Candidatus Poseidoniaceae archaeon]
MGKRGVLVMNIGTPDEPTTESVRTYLREFLLDPDVIDLPTPLRHLLVRGIILRTRPQKIAPRYESIWMEEGSPLRVYTQRMTKALEASMDDIQCEVGMRYGNPSIRSGLEKLKEAGVDELLLAPMFPHYAQATTGSSLKHVYKQLKAMDWEPAIIELPHFPSE